MIPFRTTWKSLKFTNIPKMLFFTFLFFLFDAVTCVTLNLREGKIEGTTKYSSIGDKSGFQMNVYIRLSDWSKVL